MQNNFIGHFVRKNMCSVIHETHQECFSCVLNLFLCDTFPLVAEKRINYMRRFASHSRDLCSKFYSKGLHIARMVNCIKGIRYN